MGTNFIILILGAITCVFSAAIGCTQSDLKKVIAYSTCSQLGYMILICGYGYYNISLYHIFNHGIFKALLFLSGGLIIHTLSNEQNMLNRINNRFFSYSGFPIFNGVLLKRYTFRAIS